MQRLTENKIVLVVRETRLEELKARFNTVSQARFYVEQVGGDFHDYENEDAAYQKAQKQARDILDLLGRVQVVHRRFLPNFMFGPDDLVVAIGQDGLVANTLKYLDRLPLIGVNPDPARYDGQLLPFEVGDLAKIVPEVFRRKRGLKTVTMAKATLNNGQTIHAVNDLFIGPKSHGSARYTIRLDEQAERHSSSGVIVSTGLGSTGWLTSLITGASAVAAAFKSQQMGRRAAAPAPTPRFPWDAQHLFFTVREPFPSKTSTATLVFGRVTADHPLKIESHMPERGVIFSDGIEADFLEFNAGAHATIGLAERKGLLVE
ncbi:MAG: sugar kinase [Lacunisphaera sp.]|nr:sugar kinase [Lacunisphaera sp.]